MQYFDLYIKRGAADVAETNRCDTDMRLRKA